MSGIKYHGFFKSTFHYREYLIQSIARDLRKKYKRTSLGYVWSMLNPILMLVVLTLVFSHLLPKVENYSIYLFSALLGWQYFSGTVNDSIDCLRLNIKIIQQVPIPKYIFIVSIALSNLVNFLLSVVALAVVAMVVGRPLPWTCLLLPLAFLPIFLMTVAFALLFSLGNVFFEDVKHLSRVVMQAWYYMTPVLYGVEMMPASILRWLELNPLFYPIQFLRDIIYRGTVPDPWIYLLMLAVGLVLLGLALVFYRKTDDKLMYFL